MSNDIYGMINTDSMVDVNQSEGGQEGVTGANSRSYLDSKVRIEGMDS